jgi:hypothetical protein
MINETYDKMVTGIVPMFVLGWSNNTAQIFTSGWSYAEAVCLTADEVEATSRQPAGIPSSAASMGLGSFVICMLLGSLVWTML